MKRGLKQSILSFHPFLGYKKKVGGPKRRHFGRSRGSEIPHAKEQNFGQSPKAVRPKISAEGLLSSPKWVNFKMPPAF